MRDFFIDSSALYALADHTDQGYLKARAFLKENQGRYFLTSLVFVEAMSLLTKRVGKARAVGVGNWILASDSFPILHVDAAMQREAWRMFEGHSDKDWDMVDCSSFAFMRRHGLSTAFSFDRHFAQAGFQVVPERR